MWSSSWSTDLKPPDPDSPGPGEVLGSPGSRTHLTLKISQLFPQAGSESRRSRRQTWWVKQTADSDPGPGSDPGASGICPGPWSDLGSWSWSWSWFWFCYCFWSLFWSRWQARSLTWFWCSSAVSGYFPWSWSKILIMVQIFVPVLFCSWTSPVLVLVLVHDYISAERLKGFSRSFSSLFADIASHQSNPVWLKTADWTRRRSRLFQLLTRTVWWLQEAGRDKSGCTLVPSTVPTTTTTERKHWNVGSVISECVDYCSVGPWGGWEDTSWSHFIMQPPTGWFNHRTPFSLFIYICIFHNFSFKFTVMLIFVVFSLQFSGPRLTASLPTMH